MIFPVTPLIPPQKLVFYFIRGQIAFRLALRALDLYRSAVDAGRDKDITFTPAIFAHK
jgi:hypothetical protein